MNNRNLKVGYKIMLENKLEVLEKHKKWLAEFHQTMQKNREKEE